MQSEIAAFAPYALAIFVFSFAGGLVPLVRHWPHDQLQGLMSLSAGIILGVLFLDLLPAVARISPEFYTYTLLGFLLLFVFEKFVFFHPHETEHLTERRSGFAAYVSISIHSLLDGVVLGSSALLPHVAPAILFAIFAHKVPDTFSLAGILTYFHFRRRSTVLLLLVFALLTPLGGVLAIALLRGLPASTLGIPVALAAGTFLFIATSDLLPHTHGHHEGRYRNLAAMLTGIALIALAHRLHWD